MFTPIQPGRQMILGAGVRNQVAACAAAFIGFLSVCPPVNALAQSIEDARLWRTELRITVCSDKKAGTDSPIIASLAGISMFLNRGEDDFKKGRTYSYDLWPPKTVGEVREIRLSKKGPDALCVDTLELSVNHPTAALRPAFTIFSARLQRWLRQGPGESPELVVDGPTLRRSGLWNLADLRAGIANPEAVLARNPIERAEIEQVIETFVGAELAGNPWLGWGRRFGDRHVALRPTKTPNVAKVDLDLGRWGRDRKFMAIDVDFNLIVTCNPKAGTLDISTTNFRSTAPLTEGFGTWDERIRNTLRAFGVRLGQAINIGGGGICGSLNPRFDSSGNLRLL